MKMTMRIEKTFRLAAVMAVFLMAVLCARAEMIVSSAWDSDLDGWTSSGAATVSSADSTLKLSFPKQTAPVYSSVRVSKTVAAGYRPYRLSMRFKAAAVKPSTLIVYIKSASGRAWYKSLAVNGVGDWRNLNTLVTYESGWNLGPGNTAEDFENDMLSITEVSVLVVRSGITKPHSFEIDDFILDAVPSGSELPTDSDGDGMLDKWEIANTLDAANPADAAYDDDGDGLRNLEEFLAGTDPKDPSSTLEVHIESAEDEGVPDGFILTWSSVAERYYQVWRSTNLVSGFQMLQGGIEATPPVNVYVDSTAPDKGSSFYRIELE